MNKFEKITEEFYNKIKEHYGSSVFKKETPKLKFYPNIYSRLCGFEINESEVEDHPSAEYDRDQNIIFIYTNNVNSKAELVKTLIHEYKHYLQSGIWMERYYKMGYSYETHPYELEAIKEEANYKMFLK